MKKYFTVFQQSFSRYTAYRLDILLQIIQSFISPLIIVGALSFSTPTGQLTTAGLIPYYFLISLIYPLIRTQIDEEIDELTHTGDINTFLVKPFSLPRWLYAKSISEKLIIFITLSPLFSVVIFANRISFSNIFLLLLSLILGFSLSFFISFFVGLFCFWIDEFWAIHNVKHVTIMLFGGVILPYSFFPDSLGNWLKFTPFPYIANWPVKIIQNQASPLDFLLVLLWILIFITLSRILQSKAINKYSFTAS
jgi:ABC-2 type transport system permease protein